MSAQQYKFGDVVYVKAVVVDEPRVNTSNRVGVCLAEGADRTYTNADHIVPLARVTNAPPMNLYPEPRDSYGLPMIRVRTRTGVETWLSLRDLVRIVEDEGLINR